VRRAPSIAFGHGLLVLAGEERLLLLDDLAGRIWRGVESGLSAAEITKALIDANPTQSDAIRRDVSALLSQWSAEGLLDPVPGAVGQAPAPAAVTLHPVWAGQWRCSFGDLVVDLAVENPRRARLLGRLFEHFPTDSADVNACVEVRENHEGEAIVFVNGREYARTCGARNVQRALIELVWPHNALCALIHAGAVAHGDRAACFPGISGSGKTTLIARLVARGLTYLADDLTAIGMCGRILPWPMPMSVKLDSWNLLSDSYPTLEAAPAFEVKNTWARRLKPATDAWQLGPTPTHVLIFPQFSPGAPTQVVQLTQFDALRRLIEAGFLIESPISMERAETILGWLNALPAYSLCYGDVDEAASRAFHLLRQG